jgi:PBP1b-binding outer membrane lipoprotein LpoB
MMNRRLRLRLNTRPLFAGGILAALLLAGCASAPPAPTEKLQAAQQAIASAERTEAGRYAAAEMGAARTKLASADVAVTEKRMVVAAQLADESRAEAELASARTASAKATAVNDDMKRNTSILVDEMKRSSGESK